MRKKLILFCMTGILVFLLSGCKKQEDVYLEPYQETEKKQADQMQTEQMQSVQIQTEEAGLQDYEDGQEYREVVNHEDVIIQDGLDYLESENNVQTCYVYVCGAVVTPGVYSLPAGSRIFEAIELAGGLTTDADACSVNQALEITDGMMLLVYTKEETKENHLVNRTDDTKQSVEDNRLDINKAGVSELMQLSGIGRAKAEAIVNYRMTYGAFTDIEDLMNIPGIKEGIFEQIKEQIKVDE